MAGTGHALGTRVAGARLQRHFVRLGLNERPGGRRPDAYGRFEAGEFGGLWTGDGLHGPVVAGATAVLLAFVDDFSRAAVGWRWGHAEDTVRLEAAFRRGPESAGVPRAVFVDRGSAFVSAPFHRTLATLGIRIVHSRPGADAVAASDLGMFEEGGDHVGIEIVEAEPRRRPAGPRYVGELQSVSARFREVRHDRDEPSALYSARQMFKAVNGPIHRRVALHLRPNPRAVLNAVQFRIQRLVHREYVREFKVSMRLQSALERLDTIEI